MKPKCILGISDESLASKLKYAVRFTPDFEDLVQTSDVNVFLIFYIDSVLKL